MRVGIWLAVGVLAAVGGLDAGRATGRAAPASTPSVDLPPEAVRTAAARLRETAQPGPDGSLVIANSRYRAVFSAREGIVYTPRVGGRLEPRLTWAYRARTLAADTVTRRLDAVTPAVSASGEHVVDFARSGLVERYEGEGAAVEQIFVLTERPAGRGDVRIEGDVTFAGRVSAVGGGLRFEAPGLPAFSYAAPIAFDADDRPIPVRVAAAGSTLSLVLDGAALDGARWPVTIDPLLGIADVDDTDDTTTAVDIAYDPRRGQFLVVYDAKPQFSDEQTDIMLRRYYEDGDPVGPAVVLAEAGSVVYHQTSSASWTDYAPGHHPRIACDDVIDRCLVVWQRDGVSSRIRALLISGAGTALGTSFSPGPFAVEGFVPNHERFPRVVARRMRAHAAADPAFLVTWTEYNGNATYAQFARVSGTGVALGETHMSAPYVNVKVDAAYDPFFDLFLAVWKGQGGVVAARTVSPTSGAGIPVSVTSELTSDHPLVTFDLASKRYVVAYNSDENLRGRMLASDTSPIGDPINLTTWGDGGDRSLLGLTTQNGIILTTYTRTASGTTNSRVAQRSIAGTGIETLIAGDPTPFGRFATSNGGYRATVGFDDVSVKIANMGRSATGMVQGDANDFDGDGLGDLYLYRPSTGTFFVRKSSIPPGSPLPQSVSFNLGGEGHVPVVLDWDGDSLADIGVFTLLTGRWTIRLSSTGANEIITLGRGGDVLVPGDYLGGVGDEIAVWRPLTGEWFIRERGSSTTTTVVWGQRGDQPVPADVDNDGKRELCVFRQGTWLQVKVNLTGLSVRLHGQIGDVAFGGNFVGGAEADQAVYRTPVWHIKDGGTGAVTTLYASGRLPVTLDWNGDGLLDVGTWNEMTGEWIIMAAGATTTIDYGDTGDIPLGGQ